MNSSSGRESMESIAHVIGSVHRKGVRVWSENGQLRYKAPKGAVTREEIERLRTALRQLLAHSGTSGDTRIPELLLHSGARLNHAPVTFSQLQHWHAYNLAERPAIRQVASATRLSGRLNVNALQESLRELVRRHDALRTRIVVIDESPVQEIRPSDHCEIGVDDLRALPELFHETEVQRGIAEFILQPVDVSADPLCGVRLLKLRENEHVLIVAMEHMISDAFSMGILLRELFTAYRQAVSGQVFSLPPIPVQFADYALWQKSAHNSWLEKHGRYWHDRLAGCPRLKFPDDQNLPAETSPGWGAVPLRIGSELKAELREWCRARRTTIAIGVLTVYIALVLRWCRASELVIQYVTDGRVSSKLANTIGYFASVLYLRIALREEDTFADLLDRVVAEYCTALEHADLSCMEAQVPRPEFARNTVFNWVPAGLKIDLSELSGSDSALMCSAINFEHPMLKSLDRDNEPGVLLFDVDDEITGHISFPLSRFSRHTMKVFGGCFLRFVTELLKKPERPIAETLLLPE